MLSRVCLLTVSLCAILATTAPAQDRRTKVFQDRELVSQDERWIYNDLAAAHRQAQRQNKPLLVVLRCIP